MRAVLGIDAAWTAHNPSGVALAVEEGGRWRLVAVAASYELFYALGEGRALGNERPRGSKPDPVRLLAACEMVAGRPVDLVAVDMPLSQTAIVGRRASDSEVTKKWSRYGAATHAPSELRPGKISDEMRADFAQEDYQLATEAVGPRALIEVYPHPALIRFLGAGYRLPYKAGKTLTYWPGASPADRRARLIVIWRRILAVLEERIAGVIAALPVPSSETSFARLKAFEDRLDADVCAAVAVEVLEGRASPYGDAGSAIWIPGAKPD